MTKLVLGPMLRYTDQRCVTVWVETDSAGVVQVLGASARTFHVCGHHYALVVVGDLEPGSETPYTVTVNGETVWPEPGSAFPPSVIRTARLTDQYRLVFGSCRVTAPHDRTRVARRRRRRRDLGVDALRTLALRMSRTSTDDWPDGLLMLGDQVYADRVSPRTLEFIRGRRDPRVAPGAQVADFEEYTRLYQEAWSDPVLRWLFSSLPSAMIFDDHDVHDDWNTSAAWRRAMQSQWWWEDRIAGGLTAYWIYQHLGNLPPQDIAQDGMLGRLQAAPDGARLLRDYALAADREIDGRKGNGVRWSYRRDYGAVRLVVIDSRCGRVLQDGPRRMVDDEEWAWIEEQARGGVDHLLIASSLPVLLPAAMHHVEGWNEAVCAGAWGGLPARLAERLRQGADLEHWAAFRASFDALTGLATAVACGHRGTAPAMVCFLSGDVHFSYLAETTTPEAPAADGRVFQAVSSPMRNPVHRSMQLLDRFVGTRVGRRLGLAVARTAGVPDPAIHWRIRNGPRFQNGLTTLEVSGRAAQLTLESAVPAGDGADPRLQTVYTTQLV